MNLLMRDMMNLTHFMIFLLLFMKFSLTAIHAIGDVMFFDVFYIIIIAMFMVAFQDLMAGIIIVEMLLPYY